MFFTIDCKGGKMSNAHADIATQMSKLADVHSALSSFCSSQ